MSELLAQQRVEDLTAGGLWEQLWPYAPAAAVAVVVSLIATPVMRRIALTYGIVDWPDLKRKNHKRPVAYLGGLAIFLGWLVAVLYCLAAGIRSDDALPMPFVEFPIGIVLGAAAITITGVIDDVYGIRARVKVGGQLFAAAALALEDVGPQLTANAIAVLGLQAPDPLAYFLGTLIIAFFVVGGCNAMNLLDGLDGLAAGVTTIAMLGFLGISLLVAARYPGIADGSRIVMCLATVGAALGFLVFNFNPARIFMGDAGSLLLGFLCAATMLMFTDTGSKALLLTTACLIVFALPIVDSSLAIVRRKAAGMPILAPDNQHLHHLLRRAGLSVKQSVGVMYALATLFAVLGVTMVLGEVRWRYVLAVTLALYVSLFGIGFWAARAQRRQPTAQALPEVPTSWLERRQRTPAAELIGQATGAPLRRREGDPDPGSPPAVSPPSSGG